MTNETIPFCDLIAPHIALKAELMKAFEETIENAAFIGGEPIAGFEKEFAAFTSTAHAVSVANGTEALRLALVAMNVPAGSSVVTVPNTFIATTEAISMAGCGIDFVDIDAETSLMDPNRLEEFLKKAFAERAKDKRPSAIIPVHLYGQCVDMDAVNALAKTYGIKVLEDASQAHGATYKGNAAGSLGDAGTFSFYPSKNLGACGEAGAVVTNDEKIAATIRMIRDHGQKTKYYHQIEGCNGRMDALQARMLRIKLKHLPAWNKQRAEAAQYYDAAFAKMPWIRLVKISPDNRSCYHLYVIHVKERDALQKHLNDKGVMTGQHYPVPLHMQECYRHMNIPEGTFPHAEKNARELLSLPMFPELGLARAKAVVEAVASFPSRL